jgi:hypothetical protein
MASRNFAMKSSHELCGSGPGLEGGAGEAQGHSVRNRKLLAQQVPATVLH